MERVEAQSVIATVHSFRFFGLGFILPGRRRPQSSRRLRHVRCLRRLCNRDRGHVGPSHGEGTSALWLFVVAFNFVGTFDIILDYYHAVRLGLPALAGQLGAAYAIPIIYVPVLMITHFGAFYWLLRPQPKASPVLISDATAP
jgi:hypothetical protein